eukprot:TRINITY_DN14689_c1_g1_i1.p1 TRINITY_DN14689_c1_g1~~TRINITY_DN14689_c1_g1_i1.p1  ORF type:complete len:625 (+),score=259.49 TRINITY_DN14689_c1_g1_i1:76-1875(+)
MALRTCVARAVSHAVPAAAAAAAPRLQRQPLGRWTLRPELQLPAAPPVGAALRRQRRRAAAPAAGPSEIVLQPESGGAHRLVVAGGKMQWVTAEGEAHDVSLLVFTEHTGVLSLPDTDVELRLPVADQAADPGEAELAHRDAYLTSIADVVATTKGEWKVSLGWLPRGLYDRYHRRKEEMDAERRRKLVLKHTSASAFEDVTEFLRRNEGALKEAKARAEEDDEPNKGFLDYASAIGGWVAKRGQRVRQWAGRSAEEQAERKRKRKSDQEANRNRSDAALQAFYQTQELCNLMKFKAVTFDDGREPGVPAADFAGWSRTIINNYDVLKKTTAFSNMAFHVVRDPSKIESKLDGSQVVNYRDIEDGSLTDWMGDSDGKGEEPADGDGDASTSGRQPAKTRPPPFSVNYTTGEVTILDTCSPEEMLDFLEREAGRAEQRQQQIVVEQQNMYEELAKVMEKTKLKRVVFNSGGCSIIDKDYKKLAAAGRSDEYILPADVFRVIKELDRTPLLYRKHLKGQILRILPNAPARAYYVDAERGEVCFPKDFWKDTFLPVHSRYAHLNSVQRFIWSLRYVATLIAVTLIGDVDWPAFYPITWPIES